MYWVIYTKSNCINCDKVKSLLYYEDVKYINCDNRLDTEYNKLEFLKMIKNKIGFTYNTFPMCFLGDEFIGGYKECCDKYNDCNFGLILDF